MVIKRNWKSTNLIKPPTITFRTVNQPKPVESDDSNDSMTTMKSEHSNSEATGQHLKKTYLSNPQMAESVLRAYHQRYNGRISNIQTNSDMAWKSMELMRLNVQEDFNKEINEIVQKYMDSFFRPAQKNIKENLGENSISDNCIRKMQRNLMENAIKQMYATPTPVPPQFSAQNHIQNLSDFSNRNISLKRKEPELNPDKSPSVKRIQTNIHLRAVNKTKQVFWNVSALNSKTEFVYDFNVNRAFGFSESSKERLASKHPELIRYLTDVTDKDWLIENEHLLAGQRNSRILLLVRDEVLKIAQRPEYHTKIRAINELIGVKVSTVILEKMRTFFSELSMKSQTFMNKMSGDDNQDTGCKKQATENVDGMILKAELDKGSTQQNRTSSLCSSHATLSALLANNNTAEKSVLSEREQTPLLFTALQRKD